MTGRGEMVTIFYTLSFPGYFSFHYLSRRGEKEPGDEDNTLPGSSVIYNTGIPTKDCI